MVVPDGEPCGCLNKQGCLDSMFCSCECANCMIQRRVDAGLTCYTCRMNCAQHFVDIPDYDGSWSHRDICSKCFKVYRAEMGFLDEDVEDDEEPETPDNLTELSSITDYRDDDQPDIDPDAEEEELDSEELQYLWEMYWHRFNHCSSP